MRGMNSIIPVDREMDHIKKGTGRITVNGTKVTGKNTNFTILKSRDYIIVDKKEHRIYIINIIIIIIQIAIQEVISDTELILKDKFSDEELKDIEYKTQPKLNHSDLFKHVYDSLNNDQVVGIFPEGGSHDRTTISF